MFALAMTLYGLVLTLMPDEIGEALFGSAWASASAYVGVLVVGEVFNFSLIPAVDVVRVLGTPRQLVRTRMWTTGVLVVASLGFGALYGAEGVIWASLVVRVVSAYVWWSLAMRLTRSDADEGVPTG
jgi:O-antigen/teichoic acid export membrane protein